MSDKPQLHEIDHAMKQEVKAAVDEWAREVLFTRENLEVFWATAFDVLQDKAQEQTGKFVVASIGGLFRKLAIFLLLGGLVYSVGGWTAMVGLFKSLFVASSISH